MNFTTVVEHCKETGLYVCYVPGFMGVHSQGKTMDELNKNLQEVIALLLKDGKITKSSRIQPQNNVGKNVGIDNMHYIIL